MKDAIERVRPGDSVFFAPTHLRAGKFWSRALAQAIAGADAFVLLIGEKGVGDWQVMEYDEALDKRVTSPSFPLMVVLLQGQQAPGLPFLRRLHWIVTPDPASDQDVARLVEAAVGGESVSGELWRHTSPYRGLAAMEEKDSDYFFGRETKTVEVLKALALADGKVVLLLGNSGVGKSSLARAGVVAALKRQTWPEGTEEPSSWPAAFAESRRWCFLAIRPGNDAVRALVAAFFDVWQGEATDPNRTKQQAEWQALLEGGTASLRDLLDTTERRYRELGRDNPPAFLLYIDQGEELYVEPTQEQHGRETNFERQGFMERRRRFSMLVATCADDPRLHVLMSMRSDFLGELQKDEALVGVRYQIEVLPLRREQLAAVVSNPAKVLSARFEPDLERVIVDRALEESAREEGALPLLSYTLDDMWTSMVKRGDGVLRLGTKSFDLVAVLTSRADAFLAAHPGAEAMLRQIMTLRLATIQEGEKVTRRRARRSEFSDAEWRLVTALADHPNRLLVTVTSESGETHAEVAHETIFGRWEKLREWVAAEQEFLAWKSGFDGACRAWEKSPVASKKGALLMGAPLAKAQEWLDRRREGLTQIEREFVAQSSRYERVRRRREWGLVLALPMLIIVGLVGVIYRPEIAEEVHWWRTVRPYRVANFDGKAMTLGEERAIQAGEVFRECAKDCPEMVVLPAGRFMMGSPANEKDRGKDERQQQATISRQFAVSKFEVTFDEWDACTAVGACPHVNDSGFGRGKQPVINVSWEAARRYVGWLSTMTGRPYRLLRESEWEYAARAGSDSAYAWGDDIKKDGHPMANCIECGSQWDGRKPAPVGAFPANKFGLHDMHGNVWEWVADCYEIQGTTRADPAAPGGDCERVVRGGSWSEPSQFLRSAVRSSIATDDLRINLGIRVGRALSP